MATGKWNSGVTEIGIKACRTEMWECFKHLVSSEFLFTDIVPLRVNLKGSVIVLHEEWAWCSFWGVFLLFSRNKVLGPKCYLQLEGFVVYEPRGTLGIKACGVSTDYPTLSPLTSITITLSECELWTACIVIT